MRKVLIAAAALVALAGQADAAALKHVWYYVDWTASKCVLSQLTPEQVASQSGTRISSKDVTKDADGDLTVVVHGNLDGKPYVAMLLSSEAKCEYPFSGFTQPIDSSADAAYCSRNGGQPTFADGKWNKCIVPDMGKPRTPISLPVRALADAALCSLAGGKVTMAHGDWDACIIP
jgi:hypothetical protein